MSDFQSDRYRLDLTELDRLRAKHPDWPVFALDLWGHEESLEIELRDTVETEYACIEDRIWFGREDARLGLEQMYGCDTERLIREADWNPCILLQFHT